MGTFKERCGPRMLADQPVLPEAVSVKLGEIEKETS